MFSTPSSRLHNSENSNSVMRKPHVSSARKAFQDRSVNSKINQPLKNTPISKNKIKLFLDLKAPEATPAPVFEDVPDWMMETSTASAQNDLEYSDMRVSKADIHHFFFGREPTPPPSPVQDCQLDFEILNVGGKLNFEEEEEIPKYTWDDDEYDLPWERPQISYEF